MLSDPNDESPANLEAAVPLVPMPLRTALLALRVGMPLTGSPSSPSTETMARGQGRFQEEGATVRPPVAGDALRPEPDTPELSPPHPALKKKKQYSCSYVRTSKSQNFRLGARNKKKSGLKGKEKKTNHQTQEDAAPGFFD